jgi:hypothetical protein
MFKSRNYFDCDLTCRQVLFQNHFDSDCFDQKEVLEEPNPRFRAAAIDIYIEGRPSVAKYIITLDQELFSDPKLSLAH